MIKFNNKKLFLGSIIILPLLFNPFTGNVEGVKFIVFLLLSLWLCFCNTDKNYKIKNPLIIILATIIITGGLATIFSGDIYTSFFGADDRRIGFLSYLAFSLLALNSPKLQPDKIKKYLIVSGFITSFTSLTLGLVFKLGLFENRISGTLGNPNFLGQFLAVTIFLTAYELINRKKRDAFLYISFFVQISALLMTGNRASILALIIGLVLYLFLNRKRIVYLLYTLGFSSLITILFWQRFISLQSISTRFELYFSAIKAIIKSPLLGVGFEQIQYALDIQNRYTLVADRVHQLFLDATLSGGIFFGVTLVCLSFFVLKKLYKKKDFFYAFLIMLLSLQFGFMGVFGLFLFAVSVGIAIKE